MTLFSELHDHGHDGSSALTGFEQTRYGWEDGQMGDRII